MVKLLNKLFEGVCLPYYRHPSSAACFPAPSGSRLRRLVGHDRAWPGMAGRTLDRCKAFRTFARAPPKIAPNLSHGYTENDAKSAKKSPIGKWDLGAQTCSKPILRKDSQRTLSGNVIQFSIGFGTQNWPQIHQNFDFFRFFRQIHTFNYFLSPGVSVVYWDSLRAAERPI